MYIQKIRSCIVVVHNITQRCGTLKYNNGMLEAQFELESPCTTFEHPIAILRGPTKWELNVECCSVISCGPLLTYGLQYHLLPCVEIPLSLLKKTNTHGYLSALKLRKESHPNNDDMWIQLYASIRFLMFLYRTWVFI